MISKFRSNSGGSFEDPDLNFAVLKSSEMDNFIKKFGLILNNELQNNGGDINKVIAQPLNLRDRPIFGGLYNLFNGLTILIHDTEYTEVQLDDFAISGNHWSAVITVTVHDHFGEDKHDSLTYQSKNVAFADWWLLQHTRGYVPFETIVHVRKNLFGTL